MTLHLGRLPLLILAAVAAFLLGRMVEARWWLADVPETDDAWAAFRQRLESEEFTDDPIYRHTGI